MDSEDWPLARHGGWVFVVCTYHFLDFVMHCSFVLEFKVAVNNSVFVPQQNGRVKIV